MYLLYSTRKTSTLDVMRRLLQSKNVMCSSYAGTGVKEVHPFPCFPPFFCLKPTLGQIHIHFEHRSRNIEPMQVFIFQGVPHLYTHIKTDTQKLTAYTRTETGKFYHLGTCQLSSCFSEEFSVYRENGKSERTHARKSHKVSYNAALCVVLLTPFTPAYVTGSHEVWSSTIS